MDLLEFFWGGVKGWPWGRIGLIGLIVFVFGGFLAWAVVHVGSRKDPDD